MLEHTGRQRAIVLLPHLLAPKRTDRIHFTEQGLFREEVHPHPKLEPFIRRIGLIMERIAIIQPERQVHTGCSMLGTLLFRQETGT